MRMIKLCFGILMGSLLLLFPVEAQTNCEICLSLQEKGFCQSYWEPLCALSLMHPEWEWRALKITELSREKGQEYTFGYVLDRETDSAQQSLVSGDGDYSAYWDPGGETSDTGYHRASREAVAYFLDPRSHLSESGVFQFLDLSYTTPIPPEVLDKILSQTALEGEVSSQTLLFLGEEFGIDPRFLAVRLRQEQGREGNVLLSGLAGEVLSQWYQEGTQWEGDRSVLSPKGGCDAKELLSLNGYYNPFNVSASGNGAFEVYRSGAEKARLSGWNTLEKGLWGGTEKIAREYVSTHQNTLYLQKWNVDIRSLTPEGQIRNFWGQYMQNIGAAKTEADLLYQIYEETGQLNGKLTFLIPVYEALPEEICLDPARGSVSAFASLPILSSPHLVPEEREEMEVMNPAPTSTSLAPRKENTSENRWQTWLLVLSILVVFFFLSFFILTVFPRILFQKNTMIWRK